ncbi:hypothetical protein N7U49_23940 [Streptomyces sp. AD2-2]|nr:hypothetical protein N7U49_23940 [Streptomyces sp. AD2-2]
MRTTHTAVNRTVLGATGLTLLLTGSWLAATDRTLAPHLPSWWPTAGTGTVLLDPDRLARLRGEGWWTPTVLAASIGLTLLLALWTLGHLRTGPARRLALPPPAARSARRHWPRRWRRARRPSPGWPAAMPGSCPGAADGWRWSCGSGWHRTRPPTPCSPTCAR